MNVFEVKTHRQKKDFQKIARKIYKKDPFWICPMDKEIENQFNPSKNKFFNDGEACRWILFDEQNQLVGRIAAFYNNEKAKAEKILTGGIGFFECIDDIRAAHKLFDTASVWLKSKGMQAIDGPINFGENDSNWGLLVEGFMHQGIGMPYHLPYYRNLFESYGFKVFFKQYSYHLNLSAKFPDRFWKIAKWISNKPDYQFKHFNWKESEQFIQDTCYIYNKAWSAFKEDFTPLKPETLYSTLSKSKEILDPELIWFAYYKDEPAAFFIMFPDANQIFKKMNGKLHPLNKLRFIYYKKIKTINRIRATAAGVIPSCQNRGLESGIFWQMNEVMKHKPWYNEIELSWVGDFNPKMISLYEAVGAKRTKTHHTYRYLIDKKVVFERFMPNNVKEYS